MKNAVLQKEMKVSSRSWKITWGLLAFNLILGLFVLFLFHSVFYMQAKGEVGDYSSVINIYGGIEALEMLLLAFIVPATTAGAIAGEQEKQTLDILLTTPLYPWQIIVGKLVASISTALLYLFSSLPLISIVFLVGGVSIWNLCTMFFYAVVFSLFMGSVGIFYSTVLRKSILATICSFGTELFFVGIYWVIQEVGKLLYGTNEVVSHMTVVSALFSPFATMMGLYSNQVESRGKYEAYCNVLYGNEQGGFWSTLGSGAWFWWSVIAQLFLAGIFLFLAVRALNPLKRRIGEK